MGGWEVFYEVVRTIPRGRVVTYGVVARLAGRPGAARQVGYAMAASQGRLPWHRVLGARGGRHAGISLSGESAREQRRRLEAEGIEFDGKGRVSLVSFGWRGRR